MLIPYSTDAPLYHWPFTTGGMIVANILVFGYFASSSGEYYAAIAPYMLIYGDGWHPIQWITSNFIHANLTHLVGNMIGMWIFGWIVEGKIGWWKTLLVMLSIGVIQNIIEQTLGLGFTGGSYGASAIVFGLMAMCLVWAPMNNVQCVLLILYRFISFEIAILYLVGLYIGLELATVVLFVGFTFSSEMLHLIGAGVGAVIAITMLKRGMVDCEEWDAFTLLYPANQNAADQRVQRKEGKSLREEEARRSQAAAQKLEHRQLAIQQIRELVAQGNPQAALAAHQQMLAKYPDWQLTEPDLFQLIAGFQRRELWRESLPIMLEYLRKYTANADSVRLKLAQVLLLKENRPAQALKVLAKFNPALLAPELQMQVARLEAQAQAARKKFPYEVADQDW